MAEKILISDSSSTPSPLVPSSRIVCHVCQKQFSQYTCPRCNSRYCSLQCYKSHSLRCTESFMRENVVQELQQMEPNDETKHKMLDILKRFHFDSEDEMDGLSDAPTLSEENIQKVLAGGELSFDDLSAEEKKQFLRAMASGELSKMIEPWEPWWYKPSAQNISLGQSGRQLIEPLASISQGERLEDAHLADIPLGPETPLPPLSQLTSTEPSPRLAVHLVDTIYSYCFTLRLYNGDWRADAGGSAMVVLNVSSVLGQSGHPQTHSEALGFCLEQTCSASYKHFGGFKLGLRVIEDVVRLLSLGSPALVCALSDLRRLIQAGWKELKEEKPRKAKISEIRSKLKLGERKIYFIMCWVHEQPRGAWSSLAAIVEVERSSLAKIDGYKVAGIGKADSSQEDKGKCLIQEID